MTKTFLVCHTNSDAKSGVAQVAVVAANEKAAIAYFENHYPSRVVKTVGVKQ